MLERNWRAPPRFRHARCCTDRGAPKWREHVSSSQPATPLCGAWLEGALTDQNATGQDHLPSASNSEHNEPYVIKEEPVQTKKYSSRDT